MEDQKQDAGEHQKQEAGRDPWILYIVVVIGNILQIVVILHLFAAASVQHILRERADPAYKCNKADDACTDEDAACKTLSEGRCDHGIDDAEYHPDGRCFQGLPGEYKLQKFR